MQGLVAVNWPTVRAPAAAPRKPEVPTATENRKRPSALSVFLQPGNDTVACIGQIGHNTFYPRSELLIDPDLVGQ